MKTKKKLKLKKEVKNLMREVIRDLIFIGLVGLWTINFVNIDSINGNFILSYVIGYAIIKLSKTYF